MATLAKGSGPPSSDASVSRTRRELALAFLVIVAATIGVDRVAKLIAQAELAPGPNGTALAGLIRWQYEENRGAMLSLGSELSEPVRFWVFTVGVGILLAGLTAFVIWRATNRWEVAAGALAVGGGAGNLIDRILYSGAVIDFAVLGIGPVRTGVFNLADVAIVLGVGLYLLISIRASRMSAGNTAHL